MGWLRVEGVQDITRARVNAYLIARAEEVATRTANVELAGLKRMLNWAVDTGLIANNPIARVKPLPVRPLERRRPLTKVEVQKPLAASPEPCRCVW